MEIEKNILLKSLFLFCSCTLAIGQSSSQFLNNSPINRENDQNNYGVPLLAHTKCACSELITQEECFAQRCTWATVDHSYSYCKKPTCELYEKDYCNNGCVWDLQNSCSAFTRCEDYQVYEPDSCMKKDSTCINGIIYQGVISCITNYISCKQLAAFCNSTQGNGLKCSTIQDKDLCELYCEWQNNKCQAKTCESIQNQSDCTYVWHDGLQSISICESDGLNCVQATDSSFLSQENCSKSTAGTFIWDGSSCKACTGIENKAFAMAIINLIVIILM